MDETRRLLVAALLAAPVVARARLLGAARIDGARLEREARRLEQASAGGRLGLAFFDSDGGDRFAWRGDERFPMCSTFKLLLAAATLKRVERSEETLARRIAIHKADLVPWAPFAETRVGADAGVEELCAAAMTRSDNVAANLLLQGIGGPSGIGAFARTLGDDSTRLDRIEPHLNSANPGDTRDTTTPLAMLASLRALLLGDALAQGSRERLLGWLRANTTGDARVRAGLPKAWSAGDKTGTGQRGTSNDIGIAWPPGGKPLLFVAYLTGSKLDPEKRDAILAGVGRALSAG